MRTSEWVFLAAFSTLYVGVFAYSIWQDNKRAKLICDSNERVAKIKADAIDRLCAIGGAAPAALKAVES